LNTSYYISKIMIFLLVLQRVYKLIVPSTFEKNTNNSYIENSNKKIDNSKVNFFESLDNSEPNYTSYAFNSESQNSN